MTFVRVWASPCGCGRDVMELSPVPIGVRARCAPDFGGCGCFVCGDDELGAVREWNRMQAINPAAQALTLAAARRAMGGVQE